MAASPNIVFEPLQVWRATNDEGKVLRRVKLLALHPEDENMWIYEELPTGRSAIEVRYGIFPRYNLEYVISRGLFSLEQDV